METKKEITIASITPHSVDVMQKEFAEVNGIMLQVGATRRVCYNNIPRDRSVIEATLPEAYQKAVFAIWDTVDPGTDPEHSGTEITA